MSGSAYRKVRVTAGPGGWGGPLVIAPGEGRDVIYSVTGGGVHPVARRIAELTGARVVDAFKAKVPFEKIACAVVDCGGTARIGVYPMKQVPTIDVYATRPAGPLFKFITATIFVSGVRDEDITLLGEAGNDDEV